MQGHKFGDPKPKFQIAFGQRKRTSAFFPGVQISQEQSQNRYSPEKYHGKSTDTTQRVNVETSSKFNSYVDATNQTDYYGTLERKVSKDVRKKIIPHNEFDPRNDRRVPKLDVKDFQGKEISKMVVNEFIKDKRNSKSSKETNGNRNAPESEIYMLKKEETIIIVNEKRRKSKFDVSQKDTQNELTRNLSRDGKYHGTRESKVLNEVGDERQNKKASTSNVISARTSSFNHKKRESNISSNNLEQKKPSKSDEIKVKHKRKNSKTSKASNIDVKNVKQIINETKNSKSSHRKSKSRSNVKNTKDARESKSSEIKPNSSKYKSSSVKMNSGRVKERRNSKNGSVVGKKRGSTENSSTKTSKLSKGRRKSKT